MWRLTQNEDSLMACTLKAKYFRRCPVLVAKKNQRASYTWSSIFNSKDIIEVGSIWKVGDGKQIHIWEHKWIPTLSDGIPHSGMDRCQNIMWVSDLINPLTCSWDRSLIYHIFSQEDAAHITRIQLRRSIQTDKLIWNLSKDGLYTVRSGLFDQDMR
ncbi:hypothetical protein RIF29_00094 [Crotalaria pallida]|uniref:Uncharacterized protein n=1 Tax=Crotalaria pallida TaxID=3830 RepID=A0AAN9P724_CROPI